MPQDYVIKTSTNTYRIRVPDGMDSEKALSLAVATNPQFAQEYGALQAHQKTLLSDSMKGKGTPTSRSPEDEEFAKSIGLKPTDIAGVTDAAMLGVGAGGVAKTIAKRGLRAAIGPLARGIAGATGGGAAGHYLGKFVGLPEAGGVIGSLAGGVLGGFSGEKVPTPEPEPFPPEATTTGRPSMTSPSGQTRLTPPPVPVKPAAPDPFGGMTSSGRPSMTSARGATQLTPPLESAPAPRANGAATSVEQAVSKSKGPSSILSRGSTLYSPGEEPNPSNPVHVKIINDLQTRSGTELRAMAKNGDRFAAFVLRNMPRPKL
jgi:hypothetical protein